jgi:putative glutamine amidotransferase
MTLDSSPGTDDRPIAVGKTIQFQNIEYIDYMADQQAILVFCPTLGRPDGIPALLDCLDGLIVTGGDDVDSRQYGEEPLSDEWKTDVLRTTYEKELIRLALKRDLPILGICRGCQMLNISRGGTLFQDLPSQLPSSIDHKKPPGPVWNHHPVTLETHSRLYDIVGERRFPVTTSHHQAIKTCGQDVVVTARADDDVIEAIEIPGARFALGVQWHPEGSPDTNSSQKLLQSFIETCKHSMG